MVLFETEVDAGFGQRGVVETVEGVEVLGAEFGAAVAAIEVVFEEDAHFRYVAVEAGGHFYGADDIFAAVATQHSQRQLAAGEHDGFAQIVEHKAESRGAVGHGVGAVQYHKAVVVGIFALDDGGNLYPKVGCHVGGVDDVLYLTRVDAVAAAVEQWHGVIDVFHGKGSQRAFLVLHHADGAAGVDDADALSLCHGRLLIIDGDTYILNDCGPPRKKKAPEKVCGFVWTSVRLKR